MGEITVTRERCKVHRVFCTRCHVNARIHWQTIDEAQRLLVFHVQCHGDHRLCCITMHDAIEILVAFDDSVIVTSWNRLQDLFDSEDRIEEERNHLEEKLIEMSSYMTALEAVLKKGRR